MQRLYAVAALAGLLAGAGAPRAAEIGANTDFAASCLVFAQGYQETPDGLLATRFGPASAGCPEGARLKVSVTQENAQNNHAGARNEDPRILSYQADYDAGDPGSWLSVALSGAPPRTLTLRLDTTGPEILNVTGWPIRYGHLFLGVQDSSVSSALDARLVVAFDARISAETGETREPGYAGARVLLGALVQWSEGAGRANTAHFLEVDLSIAEGYARSYGDPDRPACRDRPYDRCFYDSRGRYAEGRFLAAGSGIGDPQPLVEGWVHYRLALSEIFRALAWVAPPADWRTAKLGALYFAIESQGGARTRVEFRNYRATLN